jgi:hypothetical protein
VPPQAPRADLWHNRGWFDDDAEASSREELTMSQQTGGSPSAPQTGAHAVVANAQKHIDPARRPDVLLRVRRDEGHEISAWWMIGAFVVVSAAVILLLGFVPGGA